MRKIYREGRQREKIKVTRIEGERREREKKER